MTHIQKRYNELKETYPDALLLFRVGDFYEAYYNDAVECSKILGITLCHRTADNMELSGFPFHALDTYLPKLVRAGKRVAICDQEPLVESICTKCTYRTRNNECNRLVSAGAFGNNDRVASDYMRNNKCKYFQEGDSSRHIDKSHFPPYNS